MTGAISEGVGVAASHAIASAGVGYVLAAGVNPLLGLVGLAMSASSVHKFDDERWKRGVKRFATHVTFIEPTDASVRDAETVVQWVCDRVPPSRFIDHFCSFGRFMRAHVWAFSDDRAMARRGPEKQRTIHTSEWRGPHLASRRVWLVLSSANGWWKAVPMGFLSDGSDFWTNIGKLVDDSSTTWTAFLLYTPTASRTRRS